MIVVVRFFCAWGLQPKVQKQESGIVKRMSFMGGQIAGDIL